MVGSRWERGGLAGGRVRKKEGGRERRGRGRERKSCIHVDPPPHLSVDTNSLTFDRHHQYLLASLRSRDLEVSRRSTRER